MSDPDDLSKSTQRVRDFWNEHARAAADDAERVDSSRRAQRMRFETFLLDHDVRGKSVLDVGCGLGDLLHHVRRRGLDCDYVGVDLSSEMIARCRARFPGVRFESVDILQTDLGRRFDYVVSFGIHSNVRLEDGAALLAAVTRRQFELCDVAAYVSLLTDRYAKGFAPDRQAWRAEDVLTMSLAITPYVALRHHYLPNDFSVALYRELLIDARKDLLLADEP
jgi:SAM-dependent methyltransferase